jgi:hypothetical protein
MDTFDLPRPLVIDGTDAATGNYTSGATNPPFSVYSPHLRQTLAWKLPTRQCAENMRSFLCQALRGRPAFPIFAAFD